MPIELIDINILNEIFCNFSLLKNANHFIFGIGSIALEKLTSVLGSIQTLDKALLNDRSGFRKTVYQCIELLLMLLFTKYC